VSRFIDEHRGRFGVEPICRTLDVSASAYYQRATGERSARQIADGQLLARIEQLHAANYHAYGYRRTWKALRREGVRVGRDRVKRLMRARGIQGAKRRGKPWRTTTPDPRARRRPDLVERNFSAEGWVADLSYLRCWEGLVFFAFVVDAHSRKVVGRQLAAHMRTTLVLDALRMRSGNAGPAPTSRSCTIRIAARNTPRSTTPRRWLATACWPRWGRSATRSTTRSPRVSSTASRPS
jgi:putative transposase